MLVNVQVADALWQCLCPAFRRSAPQCLRLPVRRCVRAPAHLRPSLRTAATAAQHDDAPHKASGQAPAVSPASPPSDAPPLPAALSRFPLHQDPATPTERVRGSLARAATPDLHALLRHVVARDPGHAWVAPLVRYLVRERAERPGPAHYAALIAAQASPERGSAIALERLVADMAADGVPCTVEVYEAILKVGAPLLAP